MTESQQNRQKLFEIADSQQGFFTTKQAKASGYTENNFPYYIRSGQWIREHRGIYRLTLFPDSEHSQLILWSIWSRDRKDSPQGVYSHETALSIYELSDIMPSKLHMTVPIAFRKNIVPPSILILHKKNLSKSDVEPMHGFRVTRPLCTLFDLLDAKTVSEDIIRQALASGLKKGLITRGEIKKSESADAKDTIIRMMQEI